MPDGVRFLLLFATFLASSSALKCLEGSDCVVDASCGECTGVACTRVTSHNLDDNKEVALTCLPYESRTFHQLEPEGCRVIGDRQTCICYDDYCNSSTQLSTFIISILFFVLTGFWL